MKRSTYIANDGDKVKSRAELVIDNFLASNKIKHEYEKKVIIKGIELSPDWYLTDYDAYIEFWGMESNKNYADKQRKKLKVYAGSDLRVLSLDDTHLENGPLLAKTVFGFIEDIQKKIQVKELNFRKEEDQKIKEIKMIKEKAEADLREKERIHKIDKEKKQKEINRIKAEAEAKEKEYESKDEFNKFMTSAITWTIAGVKTGVDNLFKTKTKKLPRDKKCIYCHNNLITSRHVCTICQTKALTNNLCIFCGTLTKRTKICGNCRNNKHQKCKLCRRKIIQPQVGKSVCDSCVLKIPFKGKLKVH